MRQGLLPIGILLGAAAGLAAHGAPGQPAPAAVKAMVNPVPADEKSLQRGAELFRKNCLLCHGEKGEGNGPWVEKLPEKPADLTDGEMMGEMTDGEIMWWISKGKDDVMPEFETKLKLRQRWHLVNYLRTLAKARPAGRAPGKKTHSD